MQPLWKPSWRFLKKFRIELPYGLAILPMCIYPKNMKTVIRKEICPPALIAALFKIAKIWK